MLTMMMVMDFNNNVNGKYSTIISQNLSGPSGFAITEGPIFFTVISRYSVA